MAKYSYEFKKKMVDAYLRGEGAKAIARSELPNSFLEWANFLQIEVRSCSIGMSGFIMSLRPFL